MRSRRTAAPTESIKGELLHFVVRGQDHWGTGSVRTQHDGGDVTITGKVLGARTGDTVKLDGSWSQDPKYGRQFKVVACEVVLPSDASGVVGWLATHLPQISRARAQTLVEKHGIEGVWRVLDGGDVAALCELDGITPPRAQEILAAYVENKGERDRVVRLKGWGLTDGQIARVIDQWGDDAEAELVKNPYSLMDAVDGFGWQRADQVAQRMGVKLDSPPRCSAALMHGLKEGAGHGNTYVSNGKLVSLAAVKYLGGVDETKVRAALAELEEAGKVVRYGVNIYLPKLAAAEATLAEAFSSRAQRAAKKGKAA